MAPAEKLRPAQCVYNDAAQSAESGREPGEQKRIDRPAKRNASLFRNYLPVSRGAFPQFRPYLRDQKIYKFLNLRGSLDKDAKPVLHVSIWATLLTFLLSYGIVVESFPLWCSFFSFGGLLRSGQCARRIIPLLHPTRSLLRKWVSSRQLVLARFARIVFFLELIGLMV